MIGATWYKIGKNQKQQQCVSAVKNSPNRRYKKFGESSEVENLGEGSAAGKTRKGVSGEERTGMEKKAEAC